MKPKLLSKKELLREIQLFLRDKNRGISVKLFADLCGIAHTMLWDVFVLQTVPLSEYVQTRVNKAYAEWKAGNVRVMMNADRSRFVDYRKESRPPIRSSMSIRFEKGKMTLKIGPKNRHDYSERSLEEQLRG